MVSPVGTLAGRCSFGSDTTISYEDVDAETLKPLPICDAQPSPATPDRTTTAARTRSTVDYIRPLEYPRMGSWRRREEGA
jgi:hypothetical protein